MATSPGEAVIADLPASGPREAGIAFTFISGDVRVEPVRWNASGTRLLLRVGKFGAAFWEADSSRLAQAPNFDPLFTWMTLEPLSHGDTGFYRDPATLALARRIRAEGEPLRWVANPGPTRTTFLVFRPGDRLRLRAYGYGRARNTGIPLAFASRPLLPADATRPTFLGDQTGSSRFLPYALPIVDRRTGRVAGRFGLERIELKDGRRIDLGRAFDQLMAIQDAGANGETIFALVNLAREKRIVRIRGAAIESWRLCEKKGIWLGPLITLRAFDTLPPGTEVTREEVLFDRGKGKAFGLLYRPRRADGRLVVWLHGGPTATLAGDTVPREVQDLAPLGISVLAVEQSGMLGGGLALTRRLPRLGHKALQQDMRSVARWVSRSGFPRAFLIADSFGGVSGVIAAVDHSQVYEHIFLRAPMLALRPPEASVDRRIFGEENSRPDNQREFEETIFGGRDRFAADLRTWTARLRPSSRLSLYFGNLDPVSAANDLPAAFAAHPSVKIVRSSHEMTANSREVERDILAGLGKR